MKVEISVPTSLDEVTLDQYQRFAAIDPNSEYDFMARKMLEIFCGVSDTLKVKKKDVDAVYKSLTAALERKYPLIPIFKLDGIEYGFIPNLEDITLGEYIDLDHLIDWPDLHKGLAVMYRPVTERHKDKYKIEEYESSSKYSEVMKKAPASVAIGALVFFWALSYDLLSVILTYSKNQKNKKTTQQDPNSLINTDGWGLYTRLQTEILQSKKRLHDYQLANAFIHSATSMRGAGSNLRNLINA